MPLDIMGKIQAVIFDLDGVIVDTAQFHFIAWKELAAEWSYTLTPEDNEKLKGVSRMDSVNKIAQWANVQTKPEQLLDIAHRKNEIYLRFCNQLTPQHVLPGISSLINTLKANGVFISLGSASKNARFVLDKLGLLGVFDVVVDGNDVSKSKPNPEVFLKAAQRMGVSPEHCVVLEDAPAGIEAALAANMKVIGLGDAIELQKAHLVLENTINLSLVQLNQIKIKGVA
jgi:beta-phosphoglucomutase